ncbi:hypothetical protein F0U60_18390 [Archangium minus]|uniref:Uncharacterized protein n=1 Tax=Archangium minus TaxID=83450 RepID=A0ABY9WRR0_9BACT|nr:hypothetical protein F0U60_18390 [Archangium minus]
MTLILQGELELVHDKELAALGVAIDQSALFLMLGCAVLAAFRLKETQCRNITPTSLSTRYDDRSGPTSNPSAV